jgi:diacylglycerol kinase family enzyme
LRGFGRNETVFFRNISRQINAPTIPVDVMRCGAKYALDYCLIGLEAETVRHTEKMRNKINRSNFLYRWLSRKMHSFHYLIGGIAAGLNKKLIQQRYEIEIDGKAVNDGAAVKGKADDGRAGGFFLGLSIFNSPYYRGNLHPIDSARPDDGILDMLLVRAKKLLKILSFILFYATGRYKMFPRNIEKKQLKNIRISSAEPMVISMDDILFYETALDVELLPAALRFIDASRHGYRGLSND